MLTLIARRKYRIEVLAQLQAVLFDSSAAFLRDLKSTYPGIEKSIREAFVEKRSPEELAVNLAGTVLSNVGEQISDVRRRNRVVQELQAWISDPNNIARFRADTRHASISPDVDPYTWKLQWAVVHVADLRDKNLIDRQTERWFSSEVFGALAGKCSRQREAERLSSIISNTFDHHRPREGHER